MSRTSHIADVTELRTWANDQPYSISSLKEDLESALPEEESDNAEAYANEAFEEFDSRKKILDSAYPFSVEGNTITPTERKTDSSYLFCLGLALLRNISNDLRTREFETLVKHAAESYFRGKGVRIGAPWRTDEITQYGELLQLISNLIPEIGDPVTNVAPAGGDGGWDIVVVNNFADQKYSRIIALGNCATGRTERGKGQEIAPNSFWDFFTRTPVDRNVCLTFSAVPFLLSETEKAHKMWINSISFDRLRICEHASFASEAVMDWLEANRTEALEVPFI